MTCLGNPVGTQGIHFLPGETDDPCPWLKYFSFSQCSVCLTDGVSPFTLSLPPYLLLFQSPAVSGTHTMGNTMPPSDPSQQWRRLRCWLGLARRAPGGRGVVSNPPHHGQNYHLASDCPVIIGATGWKGERREDKGGGGYSYSNTYSSVFP